MFDGFVPIFDEFRKLLAPPCKLLGGTRIISPNENKNNEFKNLRDLTSQLTSSIKQQELRYIVSKEKIKYCNLSKKSSLKRGRMDKHHNIFTKKNVQQKKEIK